MPLHSLSFLLRNRNPFCTNRSFCCCIRNCTRIAFAPQQHPQMDTSQLQPEVARFYLKRQSNKFFLPVAASAASSASLTHRSYVISPSSSSVAYSTPWCELNGTDYCPFVIALMSFIILSSLLLIIVLCVSSRLKRPNVCSALLNWLCTSDVRQRRRLTCAERESELTSRCHLNRSTDSISSAGEGFFARLYSRLWHSRCQHHPLSRQDNIWFTNVAYPYSLDGQSKFAKPPPSYDESQHHARVVYTTTNSSTGAPNAKRLAAHTNRRFVMEQLEDRSQPKATSLQSLSTTSATPAAEQPQVSSDDDRRVSRERTIFPIYRCIILNTSPSSRAANVQRIQESPPLSLHQPAQQPETAAITSTRDARPRLVDQIRADLLVSRPLSHHLAISLQTDEIPPPYEAVVTGAEHSTPSSNISAQLSRTRSYVASLVPSLRRSMSLGVHRTKASVPAYTSTSISENIV